MKLLVDEGVPVQALPALNLNRGHDFEHIYQLGWGGKKDRFLFDEAQRRGFSAIVALDVHQLVDPIEWRRLKASGLHHISLRQGKSVTGATGVARVIGSIVAAMPYVLTDLESVSEQRLVEIQLLAASSRHTTYDPRRERSRYPYWR